MNDACTVKIFIIYELVCIYKKFIPYILNISIPKKILFGRNVAIFYKYILFNSHSVTSIVLNAK